MNEDEADNNAKENETILKEATGIICKTALLILEGSLVLTNERLVFLAGEEGEDIDFGERLPDSDQATEEMGDKTGDGLSLRSKSNFLEKGRRIMAPIKETSNEESSESDNLRVKEKGNSTSSDDDTYTEGQDEDELSIALSSIIRAEGHKGLFRPSLTVVWHDDKTNESSRVQFVQKVKYSDPIFKDINDWASPIEEIGRIKTEEIRAKSSIEVTHDSNSLEARILEILPASDSEWKGLFQIEKELMGEGYWDSSRDFEELEEACTRLVGKKLLEQDESGEFYCRAKLSN